MGAMSLTNRILRLLICSNYFWQFSICSLNFFLSALMFVINCSIFYWESSYPPLLLRAYFSFLQQTYSGRSGSFYQWLGCLEKFELKSLSQLLSQFLTFFFSFPKLSTVIVSRYCQSSTFFEFFINDQSKPSFLKASSSLFFDSFSIHSFTVLYLGAAGLFVELSREDPQLIREKESLGLMELLLLIFYCLIKPSSSLTLGLHSMVTFQVGLKRSQTVDERSSFKISNYIKNIMQNFR